MFGVQGNNSHFEIGPVHCLGEPGELGGVYIESPGEWIEFADR